MGWVFLQTMLSLAAVLALMIAVVYAMKRWLLGAPRKEQNAVPIDVLGYRMLQPKRAVYIVQVLGKTLVLGVSEAGIQQLCELEKEMMDEFTSEQLSGKAEMSPTFLNFLKSNMGIVRSQSNPRPSRSRNGAGK